MCVVVGPRRCFGRPALNAIYSHHTALDHAGIKWFEAMQYYRLRDTHLANQSSRFHEHEVFLSYQKEKTAVDIILKRVEIVHREKVGGDADAPHKHAHKRAHNHARGARHVRHVRIRTDLVSHTILCRQRRDGTAALDERQSRRRQHRFGHRQLYLPLRVRRVVVASSVSVCGGWCVAGL